MQRAILTLLLLNLSGIIWLIWLHSWAPATRATQENVAFPEIDPNPYVSYTYRAELVRVIDGDTVVVDVDLGFDTWLHDQTIRLYGLDTPEITGDEKPLGLESKAWLEERLYGQEITLQSIQDKKGSFGRWLGILFIEGENINDELIENGLADKI